VSKILVTNGKNAEIHKVLQWSPEGKPLILNDDGWLDTPNEFQIINSQQTQLDFINEFEIVSEENSCSKIWRKIT